MQVKTFEVGVLGANAHALIDGDKCLLFDLGGDGKATLEKLKGMGIKSVSVLLTHGHYDHIAGALELENVPIYIYKDEMEFLNDESLNLATFLGCKQTEYFSGVIALNEGFYNIDGFEVEVIHTPGHTKGSCCYKVANFLFSGDTLFCGAFGRYDLPTGSFYALKDSIIKILERYEDNVTVYTGHGQNTDLETERLSNPLYLYAKDNL